MPYRPTDRPAPGQAEPYRHFSWLDGARWAGVGPGWAPAPSVGQAEGVAHAPDGVDQGGVVAVQLLAQVADVGLHDGGAAAEVAVPDVVQDLTLAHHRPGA